MDGQVPAGYPDIFGLLSKNSLAKINAVKSGAVAELLPTLSQAIESIAVNIDGVMEHDPSRLFAAFERYAERQYDAYAEELLPHFSDVQRYVWHLATDVTDRISNEIRPAPEFVRKDGFLQDFVESGWVLQGTDPEDQPVVNMDLSVSSGDWETYIERCFLRHLLKSAVPRRSLSGPEIDEGLEQTSLFFRLKHKFYFRQSARWQDFDKHLRAHLSNRLAHWKTEADKRAISQADHSPKANPPGGTEPKPPNTALASAANKTDGEPKGNGYEPGLGPAGRKTWVDDFLSRCLHETGVKVTRRHIWRAMGHTSARQFQYWQASDSKATYQDDVNIRRNLKMEPAKFVALLKKMEII